VATAIDDERFATPPSLDEDEVEAVLRDAIAQLPPDVARAVEDTVVEVRERPLPYPDVDPLTLGLYIGTDRLQRGFEDSGRLPARIEIYRGNIARIARDRDDAVEELRITLLHEIGHHLGYDEAGLDSLGLA
jgi:predicted Zn-dependent protease with MMP-like domain